MRRPAVIFAVVAPALLMSSIDSTIVAVGLPALLQELHTTLALVAWTLTSYQLTQTIVMPLAGKISDDWGRKPIFLGAVALFTCGSIGAGLSPNIYILIICRVLQALGGGAFLPSATGIVSEAFGERRQTAIGLFTSIFPLGGIIGPNIGGFIIDNMSWRWIFFVNVPIGILLLIVGSMVLPKDEPREASRHGVDLNGVGLFAGAMFALLYAMTDLANNPGHVSSVMPWIFVGLAVVLFILFLRQESRAREPMIELTLLRWRPFFAANVYNFLYGAAAFGFFSFIPYYATVAYGMSAGQDGAILTPRSITMAVFSTMSSFFVIRSGYRAPMIVGALCVSISLFLLSRGIHSFALFGLATPAIVLLALQVMIAGMGMGISGPASQNAALDLIPEKVAAVAGIRGMFRSTGGVLGTAGITLAVSQFHDKAVGMQDIFLVLSLFILLTIPVVFFIPDMARQRRRAADAVLREVEPAVVHE